MKLISIEEIEQDKHVIYCLVTRKWGDRDVAVTALAEDGRVLNGHLSSNVNFGKYDISSRHKWESYAKYYPFGYQLVWVDEDEIYDEGFKRAVELNKANHESEG